MTTQNPVFYDSTANVHRPMDSGATVPVTAVPVSATIGNRTQALSDGVYSGDYSGLILYVDSVNGLDTNAGTKAAPLKTIDQAFTNLNALFPAGYYSGRNITIALKAGQNYPWTTQNMVTSTARLLEQVLIRGICRTLRDRTSCLFRRFSPVAFSNWRVSIAVAGLSRFWAS
jgi:hypothetical protein